MKRDAGFWAWLGQRLSGFFLAMFIAVHFLTLHYGSGAESSLEYVSVLGRLSSWYWQVFYSLFAAVLLTHIALGLRAVYLDFKPKSRAKKIGDILTDVGLNFSLVSFSFLFSRISGILLVCFFTLHTMLVSSVFVNPEFFNFFIGLTENIIVRTAEYLVVLLAIGHGLNNLRTIAIDFLGLARFQNQLAWVTLALFLAAALASVPVFFL